MSGLLILGLLVGSAPASADELAVKQQQEIVVIGQKLKNWRGVVRSRNGMATCKTRKSTGDKAIDAIGCNAMLVCWAPEQDNLNALQKASKTKVDFNRAAKPVYDRIGSCLFEKRQSDIDSLAMQRTAGK